ncbi:MAG TPA: hypothetical protein VFH62_08620 [Dehalococcoidia bacterium]|nr:hypothetical protein [Dehalococcoidia bacterium]
MSIEKAFAIHAPAPEVYAAIERDLGGAAQHEGAAFAVLRRDPPRGIDLRVTIGGVSCWLTYRLDERDGTTDVTGVLTPFGWRYAFFKIITLGMRDQGFEIALFEGLANLKAEVEGVDGDDLPPEDGEP